MENLEKPQAPQAATKKAPSPSATKKAQSQPAKMVFSQKMPSSQGIKKVLSQASKSTAPTTNSQKSLPSPKVDESPERKLTLYQMFIQKGTDQFKAKHPDATPAAIRKLKNEHWATLSVEQFLVCSI